MVARAMGKVGSDGVVTVEAGAAFQDELALAEGLQVDRGFISSYFATDARAQSAELNEPLILVTDKRLVTNAHVLPALEAAAESGRALLIVAPDVEGDALSTLVINRLRLGLNVCAIRAPSYGAGRREALEDICALTGATFLSEEAGARPEALTREALGTAARASVTQGETVIVGGRADRAKVEERRDAVQARLQDPSLTAFDRERLTKRLARLTGGVAVIRVGGASEAEVGERKDRYDDALCASRAALAEGILPGGGVALLRAAHALQALLDDTADLGERAGIEAIRYALALPTRVIAENAGKEGSVVCDRVLQAASFWDGYDAAAGKVCDLYAAGVVDPMKVVRTALRDAASVAALLVTTEAAVVRDADEQGALE
eukprot:gnl/Chilomastix_cuspidata/275.p2 GENE.gnl/Chilomastix_cuspidata/275~~gnl/Chilomastix_cuspidata/275.p2  ORF type:complete len:377 (-),score=203.16 gnl/Chilomastix_cuspidata/275:953-2083(-)